MVRKPDKYSFIVMKYDEADTADLALVVVLERGCDWCFVWDAVCCSCVEGRYG